jgi:hypothetical protein
LRDSTLCHKVLVINTLATRFILALALVLGAAADLVVRDGAGGVGFAIWIALLAAGTVALAARIERTAPSETVAWLGGAVLFATAMAWRQSEPP